MICTLEDVYEAFHADLKRFVMARVSDAGVADDVLQEVYLRVHTHIGSVRDCSRLQAWVYQIARNAIIDHYRGRRPTAELPESLPQAVAACENDIECELLESLSAMVNELPEKYRQALNLTLTEGLTQQEVAAPAGHFTIGAFATIGYLINDLVPTAWITSLFGSGHVYGVPLAATLGLPFYINTEASLPLVRGMLDSGMSSGAALAFLITGAGTSMGAVAGAMTIARWRVIGLVVGTLWLGGILCGFAYDALLAAGRF